MKHFAVPVIVLVEADDIDQAYQRVSDQLSVHTMAHAAHRMPCLLDETLDGFEYDPTTTEVHSALDHEGNLALALRAQASAGHEGAALEKYEQEERDERNCAHEWNMTAGEADEAGPMQRIYCLKCGQDGDS